MGLIFDTSVLIASERKRLDLAALFAAHAGESFFLATVTAAELLHGVVRATTPARKKARSEFVEDVLARIEAIDFDVPVARRHADLWAELEKSGKMIGPYDLLIAATALHYGYAVATLNVAEFRHVKGLRIIDSQPFLHS
jgi:predicted nucleic acid-binding protein